MQRLDFEISDRRYQFEIPPVGKSRPFLFKLTNRLAQAPDTGKAGMVALIGAIDEKIWSEASALFTPYTFFESDGAYPCLSTDSLYWDKLGKQALGDQYEWMVFCMKSTYEDFLARIQKTPLGATTT